MATDEIRQQLDKAVDLFLKLHGEGDFEAAAKMCYSPDCVIMPQGRPIVHHSGIKDLYAKSDVKHFVSGNDESVMEGNMAVSRGHYTGYREDGTVSESGRYIVMWVPKDGTWLMKFVVWNKSPLGQEL